MNAEQLYDFFRSDVVDIEEPYLWSEDEVYAYMDDAYKMFVRLTGGVGDVSSSITRIPVVAGEQYAALDHRILKHRSARLASSNRPVKIINLQDTPVERVDDYGFLSLIGVDNKQGPVRYMVIGEEDDTARWVQIPTENDEVRLSVYRLPLNDIKLPSDEFTDVRPQHHLHLVKWMKHLAYGKQDAETFDRGKSDKYKDEFEAYCAFVVREMERQRSKVREVAYGGL